MPSREPSTTCPSPLHFTGSQTCRLGRGRKTNLLPDPGYNVAYLTNICLEQDGGCCPSKEKPPSWTKSLQKSKMSKTSHQKNVVAKISCCDVQLLSH